MRYGRDKVDEDLLWYVVIAAIIAMVLFAGLVYMSTRGADRRGDSAPASMQSKK